MNVTDRIDELRRLAEQATPGPWIAPDPPDGVGEGMLYADDGWAIVDSFLFATEERRQATKGWNVPFTRPDGQHQRDAAYIAAASPDVILSLLDEREGQEVALIEAEQRIQAAERRVAALEELLEKASDWRYSDEWVGNAFRARFVPGSERSATVLQDKDKVTP